MSVTIKNSDEKFNKPAPSASQKKKKAKVKVYNKKKRVELESDVIQKLKERYSTIDTSQINTFADFPLSLKTLKGLRETGYNKPTEIQLETIGLALRGADILGAAQTGSGKTLAFLIPILEVLYCKQWTHLDGLGALIITPTRELAYQIFETLRKVGIHHDFSAGLIIGGKDLKFERKRMDQCNIIVCTPGRLLQHMDENPLFDCVNMQVLVLDEADRCLDMGFEQTMNAIIANLPPKRQTLLFSATQTRSVRDLARLSLKDPSYVSVHEKSEYSTPKELQQNYVICNLEDKISIIWSFIKNHLKQKSIIFLSSCKQVKYIYEVFCRLRPGVSLLALYGTLHQLKRMEIYEAFCQKSSAVLFATDLAARGLDFPEVHWVVQADCPEDSATYIHRAGRTARYHRGGESLLLLLPSEEAMVDELGERKIPITKIDINPNKLHNPVRKMEAFLARDPALKETAQRAFVSYAKAVFLMKNKKIFNVQSLNTDAFAKSLGLAIPPRIRFLQRMNKARTTSNKEMNSQISKQTTHLQFKDSDEDEDTSVDVKPPTLSAPFHVTDDSDSDDGILKVKRQDHDIDLPSESELQLNDDIRSQKKKKLLTKAAIAKKLMKKKIKPNKKVLFDEDGNVIVQATKEKQSDLALRYENEDKGGIDIEEAKKVLKEEDRFDKQLFKEKVKAKHKEKKKKLKEMKKKKQEQDEMDEFGSNSEDEPDLSWLPDPDKVYGKGDQENLNDETFDKNDSSKEISFVDGVEEKKTIGKRKLKNPKVEPQNRKRQKIEKLSADLSVDQAEELALMLLQNK